MATTACAIASTFSWRTICAAQRLHRLDEQLAAIGPSWSMAPVVEAYQAVYGASFLVAVTFAAEIRAALSMLA